MQMPTEASKPLPYHEKLSYEPLLPQNGGALTSAMICA
jgi:hypothetical protein